MLPPCSGCFLWRGLEIFPLVRSMVHSRSNPYHNQVEGSNRSKGGKLKLGVVPAGLAVDNSTGLKMLPAVHGEKPRPSFELFKAPLERILSGYRVAAWMNHWAHIKQAQHESIQWGGRIARWAPNHSSKQADLAEGGSWISPGPIPRVPFHWKALSQSEDRSAPFSPRL